MPQTPARPLLLQLLAAPRLLAGGQALHVGSRKALAILALLALDGSATRERLSALLWPEADAAAGRRNLRRDLFRLRELGVPLQEAADGALALDAGLAVDALQLLREGHLPEAGGLALEGLDGVGSAELDAWLQRWRTQLAHRQGQVLSLAAEACEQRGELADALALHRQRWGGDACDEDAALQVLRLQAELGDRAGALRSFQRLADALRNELDIAPSEAAQALVRGLRQTVGPAERPAPLPAPSAAAAPLPVPTATAGLPARVPFVPRGAAQQAIESAWARGQRVYLHGAAGAGKSRLASELAAARGPWLRVACEPQDAELPYASVVRLLRALRESAPDVLLPDWVRRELAQLMPELGPAPQSLPTDEARQRLLAAVAEGWRLLMHDNFSALVLDDWQWGDAASVELWARLDDPPQTPAGPAPVAWIVAFRSAQLPAAALQRQRADIDSGRGVAVVLEGMQAAEVLDLTRALSGASGGQLFSQRLHEATEGNPFFLLETLRHLFAQRLLVADATGWSTPFDDITRDYAELPVPPSVRAAVQARVRALGGPLQRLLEAASLCSGDIDARLLARVAALDEEAAVAALEHARAAQLVHASATGWRFAHDLVRQSLLQGLSAARRRLLHERLAVQLEQSGAAPALVAAQWEAAQQPAAALRWRVAAAESALRVHALNEALAHYAQALTDGACGAVAVDIHLALARLHRRGGAAAAATTATLAAVQAATEVDASTRLRARLACAEDWCNTDRAVECLALIDAMQADLSLAPPAVRARALAVRARVQRWRGQQQAAQALQAEAIELLEGVPDALAQQAELLDDQARASLMLGDTVQGETLARRAVAAFEATDDAAGLAQALTLLGVAQMHGGGEPAATLVVLERARAVAAGCGHVPAQRGAILNLVKLRTDAGQAAAALALLQEGEALAPGFEHQRAEQGFLQARYFVHYLCGEVAAADTAALRLLAMARRVADRGVLLMSLQMVVDLYLHTGRLDQAAGLLDEADAVQTQGDGAARTHIDAALAAKRAWLHLARGDAATALHLLAAATPTAREEDRWVMAWVGAAAALAGGAIDVAGAWLATVDINTDTSTDVLAMLLVQRLALARACGHDDAAARDRARSLLRGGQVPALEAQRLQRELDAAGRQYRRPAPSC